MEEVKTAPSMREEPGRVLLPALTGSDKDGTRLEIKCMVALLSGQVQVEGRVGCWTRRLRKERWWRCSGERRGLHGSEVERVRVYEEGRGRLSRSGVVQSRRAELRRRRQRG